MQTQRPMLQKLYADTFASQRLDALVFPPCRSSRSRPSRRRAAWKISCMFIQNTDPSSNAGIPGLQVPMGLGPTSRLPLGLELDGPSGSDRRLIAIGMAIEQVLGRLPPPR